MTETSIEDIKNLVKQERAAEKELQRAREEAVSIVEKAKVEAKSILDQVEDRRYYDSLLETQVKKTEEKKKAVEKEYDDALIKLENTAKENTEKAIAFVVKSVLGE